jgi:hypothetical protein
MVAAGKRPSAGGNLMSRNTLILLAIVVVVAIIVMATMGQKGDATMAPETSTEEVPAAPATE